MSKVFSSLGVVDPAPAGSTYDAARKKQIVAKHLLLLLLKHLMSVLYSTLKESVNSDSELPTSERYTRPNGLATNCSNMGMYRGKSCVLATRENAILLGEIITEKDVEWVVEQLGLSEQSELLDLVQKLPSVHHE